MNATQRRRLRKLADFLAGPVARAHARVKKTGGRKFFMGFFANATKIGLTKEMCGTTACALGWATRVFPRTFELQGREGHVIVAPKGGEVQDLAAHTREFFGLDEDQADDAFYLCEYARTPQEEAKLLRSLAAGRV